MPHSNKFYLCKLNILRDVELLLWLFVVCWISFLFSSGWSVALSKAKNFSFCTLSFQHRDQRESIEEKRYLKHRICISFSSWLAQKGKKMKGIIGRHCPVQIMNLIFLFVCDGFRRRILNKVHIKRKSWDSLGVFLRENEWMNSFVRKRQKSHNDILHKLAVAC